MINERIALIMLEGTIPSSDTPDPHYTQRFYRSCQVFANASLKLSELGKEKKFEEFLRVALRLFNEGNETVRNGIVNVYLYTISRALDKNRLISRQIERALPKEMLTVFHRLHLAGGL